ncbi:MAG: DNA-binding protein Alba [Candidatus Micrarchaeota archaeon]|nr:DNA-binding protein Alba [Candidatus Micrarchaeota archaeon]
METHSQPEESEIPKQEEESELYEPAGQKIEGFAIEGAPVSPAQRVYPPMELKDNTIFVGKKSAMSYVLAVVGQFNNGKNDIKLKARGRAISRAIDVSQIIKGRFVPDLKIELVDISTEELMSEDGSKSRVSSLTLKLSK